MARDLGLPIHRPHHADGDALTTAQAFIALATHLEAFGFETLGSLVGLSHERERTGLLGRLLANGLTLSRSPFDRTVARPQPRQSIQLPKISTATGSV